MKFSGATTPCRSARVIPSIAPSIGGRCLSAISPDLMVILSDQAPVRKPANQAPCGQTPFRQELGDLKFSGSSSWSGRRILRYGAPDPRSPIYDLKTFAIGHSGHRVDASWSADGSHRSAVSATTEKSVAPIRFKARDTDSGRHFKAFEDLPCPGINAPDIARLVLPSAVPELAVNPRDTRDEAIGLDGPEHSPGFRIDLMDRPITVLADPERPFSPGEPRTPAMAGRRDRAEHLARPGIDLPDHGLGDLEQMRSVECRSRISSDLERIDNLSAVRIEGVQAVARSEPDPLPIEADPMHAFDVRKGAIFAKDFGACVLHAATLSARRRSRE